MISGVRFLKAVKMLPIALPTPAAECRLTRAALPLAWAYPSAIPTTTASCNPSTYRKSAGKSRNIGSSVEPGLANTDVNSRRRIKSTTASRTVGCPLVFRCISNPLRYATWAGGDWMSRSMEFGTLLENCQNCQKSLHSRMYQPVAGRFHSAPKPYWSRLSAVITDLAIAAVSGHGDPFQGRHLAGAGQPRSRSIALTTFNRIRHDEFQSAAVDDVHHDRLRG